MTRMTAITIRMWTQLPVFGKLELIFRPKKPSSHSITKITTIVHNMRFLLFIDWLEAAWLVDLVTLNWWSSETWLIYAGPANQVILLASVGEEMDDHQQDEGA
jgi:hypothetical protein